MLIPGYKVERTIGKGGMATVYLATQESLSRPIALKTLRVDLEETDDIERTVLDDDLNQTERFLQEGRIIAALQHTNVVPIYDIGATDALLYFSMEYLAGGDLQSRLGVPLPILTALDVISQIGAALEVAHQHGIVHRDVKPANILFRRDGTPLLSDFGIAKRLDVDVELTSTGRVLGSPYYLSPEQAEGAELDGRADLYSLGVILYEMLTGSRPYDGTSAVNVVIQHLQSPVPKLPGELAVLQPVLSRLMAKSRSDRFPTATEMRREIAALRAHVLGGSLAVPAVDPPPCQSAAAGPAVAEVVKGFRSGILEDLATDRLVLPSLPDVVLGVRRELESPGATSTTIARAIAADPALSAQVLRMANSALYFGHTPVRDLNRAVVRLGNTVVHQMVMMLVVAQLYDLGSRASLKAYLTELWHHSTLVAALSERIALRCGGIDRHEAMLAGLIHEIGVLPILVWAEPIPNVMGNERTLRGIMDALHGEIGRAILEQWRYPADLVAVPAEHEDFCRSPDTVDLVDVVQVANVIANREQRPRLAEVNWWTTSAARRLGLEAQDEDRLLEPARESANTLALALGNS